MTEHTNECAKCDKVQGDICRNKLDIKEEVQTRKDAIDGVYTDIKDRVEYKYAYIAVFCMVVLMFFLYNSNRTALVESKEASRTVHAAQDKRIERVSDHYVEIASSFGEIKGLITGLSANIANYQGDVGRLRDRMDSIAERTPKVAEEQ